MAIHLKNQLTPVRLRPQLERVMELSGRKILALERAWNPADGAPVFTRRGRYVSRGWTEWTQGFQYGSALLQFEATGENAFWELGRSQTLRFMTPHVSHFGVHDHGFNNISTYGALLRLASEGKIKASEGLEQVCQIALRVSGAVQAARWTPLPNGDGFIYSFNGPHSLFIDTMRSLRSLAVAHRLGQVLRDEGDRQVSLLARLVSHGLTTARQAVFYGTGRDAYDVRGRVAHESIFNVKDGQYRCPNSQQGYSPFTTWTRGLAWAILGFAEQLEFLATLNRQTFAEGMGNAAAENRPKNRRRHQRIRDAGSASDSDSLARVMEVFLRAAMATADYYLSSSPTCGVPYWDTGAPGLAHLGDYRERPADPLNAWEPVDSSAAAIAAQGLWRLGKHLLANQRKVHGTRYCQSALTIADTLFSEPYLAGQPDHQGLLMHSVYHRPNGWDYVAPGQSVPNGESSMWGDYHARELAVLLLRQARGEDYSTFFSGCYPGDKEDSDRLKSSV